MEGPEEGVLRGNFVQTGVMSSGEWGGFARPLRSLPAAHPPLGDFLLKARLALRRSQ